MTAVEMAQALRADASLPERVLWNELRGRKLEGVKFRRQHPFGPYVLDFYCPQARLCIEVDGADHYAEGRPERDARRDGYLKSQGVHVLRLPASLVLGDMTAAIDTILANIGARKP